MRVHLLFQALYLNIRATNADKWTTDLVSVRFIVRGGGNLVDTNALRNLLMG